MSHIKYCK